MDRKIVCAPMPEMIRFAVWPLGLRALFTALTSRTSPWVTLRWEEIADCSTPLERRSSVSFEGVRATCHVHVSKRGFSLRIGSEKKGHLSNVRAVQEKPAFKARAKTAAVHPPVAPKKATSGLLEFMVGASMAVRGRTKQKV